ncbi:four-carbon acid sugar kinase family protein [Desulfosarcina sp.]|uniref:four-carbon acid sugar kinase family protein n=1 Tax=Desulfosarcina sp. TaxID=2027861 RepID=UPI003970D9EF
MHSGLYIAVIADDITGAADTGVQFCPTVGPVLLVGVLDGELTASPIHNAGVAVFTNTRHAEPGAAAEIVRRAAGKIRGLKPGVVYKKIDSCLRGNLGAEIDALVQETGAAGSFVAPALPQQGRTTVNDFHLINRVPVAASEIGRDPLCPVRESRLSVLLSAQSRMAVGHVDLACIKRGAAALVERVRRLLRRGCRHITFDAEYTVHLDAVASLARDHFADMLLVGSAGLAGSLSRVMAPELPCLVPADRPRIKKWLFVCGSASRVLAEQVAMLARSTGWVHLSMDPLDLISPGGSTLRDAQVFRRVDAGGLILGIKPILETGPTENPDRVVRGLAKLAADLLSAMAVDGVFLCGGDTAEVFWKQIGACALRVREEILPGLMCGEFVGGPHNGLHVVTKAGAFGHADTLNQLVNSLE